MTTLNNANSQISEIEPTSVLPITKQKSRHRGKNYSVIFLVILILITTISLGVYFYLGTIFSVNQTISYNYVSPQSLKFTNSFTAKQLAVGTLDDGVEESFGTNISLPIASTTKIISTYILLSQHPEAKGSVLEITQNEVDEWNKTVAEDGSNVKVELGEKLSFENTLDAIFLKSANNIINSLIYKYYGNIENYQKQARQFLDQHGWKKTFIGTDASGLDPQNSSTARELTQISIEAFKIPEIREVANKRVSNIEIEGEIKNTNELLFDDSNYIGIKTGLTPQAGACLVFAYKYLGKVIVGTVLGEKGKEDRFVDGRNLVKQTKHNIIETKAILQGEQIGEVHYKNGHKKKIISKENISYIHWINDVKKFQIDLSKDQQTCQIMDSLNVLMGVCELVD